MSWAELGVHCSLTERRADDATRDVENWLKCYFMQDKVGEEFDGTISGVTSFGLFVTLDGLNVDGLVHVTELGRDYFHFDAVRHAMIGERSGRDFQLAGRVRVKVARVDLEAAKIDFTLAEDHPDGSRHSGAGDRYATDLASIADLASQGNRGAACIRESKAFRLLRVDDHAGVAEFCASTSVDCAFVADDLTRDRVRLVAMDMDSTLITIECIDEIADMQGIKPQVAAITASAMRGEIDFAESLRRRVGLLAGLDVSALERVYDERLRLSPGAEAMLAAFKAVGAKTLLVSGGFTFFTDRLKARLGLDYTASNVLEVSAGKLTGRVEGNIVDATVKAEAVRRMREDPGMADKLVVGIGDGANDLPMLAVADVSVAYHAKPVVRERATCQINYCGLDAVVNLFSDR